MLAVVSPTWCARRLRSTSRSGEFGVNQSQGQAGRGRQDGGAEQWRPSRTRLCEARSQREEPRTRACTPVRFGVGGGGRRGAEHMGSNLWSQHYSILHSARSASSLVPLGRRCPFASFSLLPLPIPSSPTLSISNCCLCRERGSCQKVLGF